MTTRLKYSNSYPCIPHHRLDKCLQPIKERSSYSVRKSTDRADRALDDYFRHSARTKNPLLNRLGSPYTHSARSLGGRLRVQNATSSSAVSLGEGGRHHLHPTLLTCARSSPERVPQPTHKKKQTPKTEKKTRQGDEDKKKVLLGNWDAPTWSLFLTVLGLIFLPRLVLLADPSLAKTWNGFLEGYKIDSFSHSPQVVPLSSWPSPFHDDKAPQSETISRLASAVADAFRIDGEPHKIVIIAGTGEEETLLAQETLLDWNHQTEIHVFSKEQSKFTGIDGSSGRIVTHETINDLKHVMVSKDSDTVIPYFHADSIETLDKVSTALANHKIAVVGMGVATIKGSLEASIDFFDKYQYKTFILGSRELTRIDNLGPEMLKNVMNTHSMLRRTNSNAFVVAMPNGAKHEKHERTIKHMYLLGDRQFHAPINSTA